MGCYEILITDEFSAAHRLRMHDGTFEPLHGHNWRVEVTILGPELDSAGLLADFTELRPALQKVTGELHDSCLNDHSAFAEVNPSTELVARYIHDRLMPQIPPGARLAKVRVWETSNCAAAYIVVSNPTADER